MPHSLIMKYGLSCAFTGHRTLGENFDLNLLRATVESFIAEGVDTFYCGMAIGFDLIAADVVLEAKKIHSEVQLIACVPCPFQQRNYPEMQRKKYERILSQCDKIELLSEHYYNGCMLARDRHMVDKCERVLAYMARNDGGTAYTVRYAQSKNKQLYIM